MRSSPVPFGSSRFLRVRKILIFGDFVPATIEKNDIRTLPKLCNWRQIPTRDVECADKIGPVNEFRDRHKCLVKQRTKTISVGATQTARPRKAFTRKRWHHERRRE